MNLLVITDIPRMSIFFDQLAQQHHNLIVTGDIQRGLKELENLNPDLVIIQNHLYGLSADILLNHIKLRMGADLPRLGLISQSDSSETELLSQFDLILNPAWSDEQLEQRINSLFTGRIPQQEADITETNETPTVSAFVLQEFTTDKPLSEQQSPPAQQPVVIDKPENNTSVSDHTEPEPIVYEYPRRVKPEIVSEFSKKLDLSDRNIKKEPEPFADREQQLRIKDFHNIPHTSSGNRDSVAWYRSTTALLAAVTIVVVVSVSVYQHRQQFFGSGQSTQPVAKKQPIAEVVSPPAPATPKQMQTPAQPQILSHGSGRPHSLPGFVPKEGLDPGYGKEHPGWELYRGLTNEYRVFRDKDKTIKAIQIVDRSGAGIQESFYTGVLKELAGVTAMQPRASEIKEGYEIRRGEAAGLELVQYRDAQGGRIRGIVITWP